MKLIKQLTPYITITAIIFAAVLGLIWLDHETNSWAQALSIGNVVNGLLFYALPALLVVFFVYTKFRRRLNVGVSMAVSVLAGIPVTFVIVVFALKLASVLQ
jgi:hypothetical protein